MRLGKSSTWLGLDGNKIQPLAVPVCLCVCMIISNSKLHISTVLTQHIN
jgi:hypothetical protein